MKLKHLAIAVIAALLPALAHGQTPYQLTPPAPNARVLFCPVPDGGYPCPSPVTVYSDSAATLQVAQPISVGSGGNLSVYFAASTTSWTVQLLGPGYGPQNRYVVVAGGSSSSSSSANIYTTGLIGQYQALPGETIAALKDYSGQNNNATGTAGTAPTLIANTGGINCPGNGGIVLPAALNSAVTIQIEMSFQPSGLANGFYAPVIGNGTPATSGVGIAIQKNGTGLVESNSFSGGFGSLVNNFSGGSTLFDQSRGFYIAGIQDLALVLGGTDVLYNSGLVSSLSQSGSGLNAMTTGSYQLCGAASGVGNTGQTYFNGQIYYALFYNVALNAAQIYQNHIALQQALLSRGVNPLPYRNDANDFIWAYGDSTTTGSGFISWPTRAVGLTGGWNVNNQGIGGVSAATLNAFALNAGQSTCSTAGGRTAVVLLTGANDAVAQTVFGNAKGILGTLTTANCSKMTRIIETMMDKGGGDALKNATDLLIRTNCQNIADYCIDLGGTVALGANGAASNATYFQGDLLHPTQAGGDVLTWVTQRGINRYFGNHDFSTATTYVAAAPASVAVTAATESGNTMTFTTAANTFAAGQCVIVTGVTPANYNSTFANSAGLGCWYVLTAPNSTTFTAWNQTTGLGVLTVAGTASVPQQVDADQVAILNFGAGNFTLQSCEGLTINDVTIIKNVNAVASTVVPFGTQTIDGAANFSLTQNSTLYLQPQLVSPAAGGCNWLKLHP